MQTWRARSWRSLRSSACGLICVAALAACAGQAAAGEPAPEPKTTLKLKADMISFNRTKGDMLLKGNVHVTRTTGADVLTVDCDEMSAVMKDEKMESVLATGNVKLVTAEYTATAHRADMNFTDNVIKLYGADKAANVKSSGMSSTGPEIIFNLKDQKVEMPKGGTSEIDLKEAGGKSSKTGDDKK